MKYLVLILISFSTYSTQLLSQEASAKNQFIGFNMTEMISQFIPFTDKVEFSGPFQFLYRVGKNGKMMNVQLGFEGDRADRLGYGHLALGFSKLKELNEKFYIVFTGNLVFHSGTLNLEREELFIFNQSGLGISAAAGFGYKLSSRVSIYSEASYLWRTFDIGDGDIRFLPPVGVFIVADIR